MTQNVWQLDLYNIREIATWRLDVGGKKEAKDDVKEADGWFFRVLFIHERHSFWL